MPIKELNKILFSFGEEIANTLKKTSSDDYELTITERSIDNFNSNGEKIINWLAVWCIDDQDLNKNIVKEQKCVFEYYKTDINPLINRYEESYHDISETTVKSIQEIVDEMSKLHECVYAENESEQEKCGLDILYGVQMRQYCLCFQLKLELIEANIDKIKFYEKVIKRYNYKMVVQEKDGQRVMYADARKKHDLHKIKQEYNKLKRLQKTFYKKEKYGYRIEFDKINLSRLADIESGGEELIDVVLSNTEALLTLIMDYYPYIVDNGYNGKNINRLIKIIVEIGVPVISLIACILKIYFKFSVL